MKSFKPFLIVTFLVGAVVLSSFTWKEQSNAALCSDMLKYATSFRDDYRGQPIAKKLTRFIKKQESSSDPYAWMGNTHQLVAELKHMFPPTTQNFEIRKRIMQLLDYPLHVNNYAKDITVREYSEFNKVTYNYCRAAKERVLSEIENVVPKEGVVIWKIYNMGYIFKTPNRTFAVDITANKIITRKILGLSESIPSMDIWKECDYERLAKQLDVLFVTHNHEDHISPAIVSAMLARGKKVVVADDYTIIDPKTGNKVPAVAPNQNLIVLGNAEVPVDIEGIKVLSFKGNQAPIACNIYLFDFDGIRVVDNGDNYDRQQEKKLLNYPAANIILASSWNEVKSILGYAQAAKGAEDA
ncbi:MAG: hypothetical protein RR277_09400, partial [Rikenellaceae bacterium]